MLPSPNNAPNFLGLNFSNLRALLRGVAVNGLQLARTPYGFWVVDTPGRAVPLKWVWGLEGGGMRVIGCAGGWWKWVARAQQGAPDADTHPTHSTPYPHRPAPTRQGPHTTSFSLPPRGSSYASA